MAGVGRSYQKTTIFAGATVFENVRLAAQAHGGQPLRLFGALPETTTSMHAPRRPSPRSGSPTAAARSRAS